MRLRLPMHGRDHRFGGSDPIPGLDGFIHWGENTDAEDLGLILYSAGDFLWEAPADSFSDFAVRTGGGSFYQELDGGQHYTYTAGGDWYVYTYDTDNPDDTGGSWYVYSSGADITLNAQAQGAGSDGGIYLNAGSISVASVDGVSIEANGSTGIDMSLFSGGGDAVTQFGTGSKVQFKNSSFASVFEVRDDGSVHIKTGQTITADL